MTTAPTTSALSQDSAAVGIGKQRLVLCEFVANGKAIKRMPRLFNRIDLFTPAEAGTG